MTTSANSHLHFAFGVPLLELLPRYLEWVVHIYAQLLLAFLHLSGARLGEASRPEVPLTLTSSSSFSWSAFSVSVRSQLCV
jgi:hypothetical protein